MAVSINWGVCFVGVLMRALLFRVYVRRRIFGHSPFEDGHRILYTGDIMGPTRVLVSDPCPDEGLPDMYCKGPQFKEPNISPTVHPLSSSKQGPNDA